MSDDEPVACSFGFFDPKPTDAPSIAPFVPKYINCDRGQLSVLVSQQGNVGTILKTEHNDEEVGQPIFGFVSCLNLAAYFQNPAIAGFVEWMMSLGDANLCELLSSSLPHVGLLLDERAYGVPPELSPHLMRGLMKEIEWAAQDGDQRFHLSHFIMVKKGIVNEDDQDIEFPLVEDEMFFNQAIMRVRFETGGDEGDLADCEYRRYVIVVTAQGAQQVRATLNDMFNIDENQYLGENE